MTRSTTPPSDPPGNPAETPNSVAFGYLRAHLLMTERELAAIKAKLEAVARAEGYTLVEVFIEPSDQVAVSHHQLVDRTQRERIPAIVVPSPHHLAVAKDHLERFTGARVILADRHLASSSDPPDNSTGNDGNP